MNAATKLSNIELFDSLLNGPVADIPEDAGLVQLPAGSYLLKIISAEVKDVESKGTPDRALAVITEVVEVQELKDSSLEHPAIGAKSYWSYWGAQGLGRFKTAFSSVIDSLEPVSTADLLERMGELEILAITSYKIAKNKVRDDGTPYVNTSIDAAVLN